jgi:hypothetical protein
VLRVPSLSAIAFRVIRGSEHVAHGRSGSGDAGGGAGEVTGWRLEQRLVGISMVIAGAMWLGSQVVQFWGLAVIDGDDPKAPMPNDLVLSFARFHPFYGTAFLLFACLWFFFRYRRKRLDNSKLENFS